MMLMDEENKKYLEYLEAMGAEVERAAELRRLRKRESLINIELLYTAADLLYDGHGSEYSVRASVARKLREMARRLTGGEND